MSLVNISVRRLVTKSVHTKNYRLFLELLIKARKDAGVTQEEAANRLNRPQSFVSKCENGERRIDVIELLEILQVIGIDAMTFLRQVVRSRQGRA
jgi:transcriptional regulator with XRE-family HTH domain